MIWLLFISILYGAFNQIITNLVNQVTQSGKSIDYFCLITAVDNSRELSRVGLKQLHLVNHYSNMFDTDSLLVQMDTASGNDLCDHHEPKRHDL